jgi:hypothetical protein
LDIPVSLARGHIRTGDFKVNTDVYFSTEIRSPKFLGDKCHYLDILRSRQITCVGGQWLSIPGRSEAPGITSGPYLGSFQAKSGHYNLDIEVLSDTQALDSCKPELLIEASSFEFYRRDEAILDCFWLFSLCAVIGISLILISTYARFRTTQLGGLSLRVSDSGAAPILLPPQKLTPQRSLPILLPLGKFGLIAGLIVIVATIHWRDIRDFFNQDSGLPKTLVQICKFLLSSFFVQAQLFSSHGASLGRESAFAHFRYCCPYQNKNPPGV